MLIGYVRVSTDDQNLALQTKALNEIGCTKIYEDKISGTKTNRPGLQLALEVLRNGDTFVVLKLKANSLPCTDDFSIAQVGTISANYDENIGKIIAEAMGKVGKDGVVTVENWNVLTY